jgi:hypothetical protein
MRVRRVQTTGTKDLIEQVGAKKTHTNSHCTVTGKQSREIGGIGCDQETSLTDTPSRVQKVEHKVTVILYPQYEPQQAEKPKNVKNAQEHQRYARLVYSR